MSELQIHQFECLSDNYSWLVHDPDANVTAVVDTPEVGPILQALEDTGWQLTHILNTHHHFDHAGGNEELKAKTGCQIIGSKSDAARIPGIDMQVGDGDSFTFGTRKVEVFDVSGHTIGHIAFWFPDDKIIFVGDALFALGCGRLFEGSPAQMWQSLQKLTALPADTTVYCAHEYTLANAEFALSAFPDNDDVKSARLFAQDLRDENKSTVPTTIRAEKDSNPFLLAKTAEEFAELRKAKDRF